jgi:hypothetical protein
MVDTNGVTRTNADVDPQFSSIVTVYDAPIKKPTPPKHQRKRNWPNHGVWTITYQDYFKFEYSANNLQQGSINAFANTAGKYGGYYLYYPQPGQTVDIGQTYPMRYQKVNHPDTNITIQALINDDKMLINMLSSTNSRNFYYDGHGNDDVIGNFLSSDFIRDYVKHRYRFVMLNSCSSAKGDLDKAFGINGPGVFPVTYYESTGIRPAAFCGYDAIVKYNDHTQVTVNGVTYDDTIPDEVPYFISNFLFYWDASLGNRALRDAVDDSINDLPDSGGYQNRESHFVIYGYDRLRIDEVNHGTDTW